MDINSAALCQIFDSIFSECGLGLREFREAVKPPGVVMAYTDAGTLFFITVDVPMSRVKFNVNTEYAYLQNFKVLQSTFRRPVSHPSPITSLITLLHF